MATETTNRTMRNKITKFVAAAAVAVSVAACASIDCPLNNRTYMSLKLTGNKAVLEDTLTIVAERTPDNPDEDTVLINRQTGLDSLAIPMSYSRTEDVYFLTLVQKDTRLKTVDTVWVTKQNEKHFESVDCSPAVFHDIEGVRFTQHAIEDIKVNYNKVTYNDPKAHLLIYFKNSNN